MKRLFSARMEEALYNKVSSQAKFERRSFSNMLEVLLSEGVKSAARERLEEAKKAGDKDVVALLQSEIDGLSKGG